MLQTLWVIFCLILGIALSIYFFGGNDQEKK